jgi:GTPase
MEKVTEARIGVIGSVDSGKSTITGVLTKEVLDDGRGSARALVMRHPHEIISGRTSCIISHYIRKKDEVTGTERNTTFIDLAGHEKYLKTTINGIHRCQVDYAMVIVGANMGVLRMTEEHLTLSLSLAIPTFIVVTKIDIAPSNILAKTLETLQKFLVRKTGGSRTPVMVTTPADLENITRDYYDTEQVAIPIPIFQVSSVTGQGMDLLRTYISGLPIYRDWLSKRQSPNINYIIDTHYHIKGIGLVVSGVLVEGQVTKGDILQLGPINHQFYQVQVKSIHNNFKESIDTLYAGQTGCFAIKNLNKSFILHRHHIKHGLRVMSQPSIYKEFEALIKILHHPTTIKQNYEPTIHCGPVCQSAKIIHMDRDCIRLGDTARVRFQFKYRPEFIEPAMKLVFREGSMRGIGKIVSVF